MHDITPPRYGTPDANEPAEYAHSRGWYRDHNGHQKFRPYGPAGPGRVYPFPESLRAMLVDDVLLRKAR